MSLQEGIFALLILVAALLYSSVGHGGASGYLAVMALMGVAPVEMRPVALSLNMIATFKYYRAGAFSWRLFWPLAIASIPCAYIGGTLTLSGHLYKPVLGVVLIYSAWHIFRTLREPELPVVERPALWVLLSAGSVLGFLSGLTGVGGGIFLSPLILYYRWAKVKTVSGIAAAFIFVNSIAALTGVAKLAPTLPSALPYWAVAAVMGGLIGAEYGSKRLGNPVIKKLLSLVLLIAGMKMIAV